jgi:hypothetical protein
MIDERNIFTKGMLINLTMGAYWGQKKLSKEQLKDMPTEIVRGVHDLFDEKFKNLLKEIGAFDNETRGLVKNQSVPFPIDGIYFIRSEQIEPIIELLEQRRGLRDEMIEKAIENYDQAIIDFAQEYPEYYKHGKSKYLSKERFAERFYFKYQFLKISAPDEGDKIVSPELYKKEMEKFRETIDEMKKDVVSTIYQELLNTTNRLKKQCTDGKPNQRTLNTLSEYLRRINDVYSDFVDRDDLKKAIENVKLSILGITAEDLRSSEAGKEEFRRGISAVINEIQNLPDMPLRRAIEL